MFGQKAPMTGMESMLRNIGLSDVLDAAKKLSDEQSIQKIIAFADALPVMQTQLGLINGRLAEIERSLRAGGGPDVPIRSEPVRPNAFLAAPGISSGSGDELGSDDGAGRLDLELPGEHVAA
jgi:hypothetical protein